MNRFIKFAVYAFALAVPMLGLCDAIEDCARPDINVAVAGETDFVADTPEVQIDVESQGVLDLRTYTEDVYVRVQEGGSAVLKGFRNDTSWHDKVTLWLDASEERTLEAEKSSSGKVQTVTENGKTGAVIVRWHDRRPEQTEWLGYNDRDTNPNANGTIYPSTMPYVVSNGCNGLNYVSLGPYGSGRRLPFIKRIDGVEQTSGGNGSCNADYAIDARYVMMVFGSQNGGGNAVISGRRGAAELFPRQTISAADADGQGPETGIFMTSRDTRLDGVDVSSLTTGFNGDWQVLSFAPKKNVKMGDEYFDEELTGLGWYPWGRYGGQNYAEILIFGEMPTEMEIQSAEHYLAEKWGISTFRKINEGEVRLFGGGSATVESGSVRLGGAFSGTLSVSEDAELVLTDTRSAPAAPAPGMAGWYDPSRADMRVIAKKTNEGQGVRVADSLTNIAGPYNGFNYDLTGNGREPAVFFEVRGWGVGMDWCDYSKSHTGGSGNTLRFDGNGNGENHCLPVRTGFMILDTRAGGGTPFLDTSVYADGVNVISKYVQPRVKSSSIFRTRNSDPSLDGFVTNSPAFLNGVTVNSGKHAFNSRPELLSFCFTQDMPVRCIGAFNQTGGYTSDPTFELRHGEIIFYPEALSERDRKDTEAYLMAKWLGVTPNGYGRPQQMTVTGAGSVKTANGAMRPKTAADFTGRLQVSGDTLTFSIDATSDSSVTDAISLAAGELSTEGAVTVDLRFLTEPKTGEYTLISAKTWNEAEVELGEVSGSRVSIADYDIVRDGNRLLLKVWRKGMRVIIQ